MNKLISNIIKLIFENLNSWINPPPSLHLSETTQHTTNPEVIDQTPPQWHRFPCPPGFCNKSLRRCPCQAYTKKQRQPAGPPHALDNGWWNFFGGQTGYMCLWWLVTMVIFAHFSTPTCQIFKFKLPSSHKKPKWHIADMKITYKISYCTT